MASSAAIIENLEATIAGIESESSAEVVVSVARVSGRYGDVDLLWAWLWALSALATILWSQWSFHPDYILLNVILAGLLGWFLSRRLPAMRRLFTTPARRLAQLENAARLEFLKSGVDATRGRTGILVYLSALERGLTLVADRAVLQAVPEEELRRWEADYRVARNLDELLSSLPQLLQAMRPVLARHLPRSADDVDELPNHVRMDPS